MTATIPIRLPSISNQRLHWAAKYRLLKSHKEAAYIVLPKSAASMTPPYRITLTRVGPRLLDRDNLVAAFKGVIDGIASRLGLNDNDPRLDFIFEQVVETFYAIRIRIEEV